MKRGWYLAENVIAVSFFVFLPYLEERGPNQITAQGTRVVDLIIVISLAGERGNEFSGFSINHKNRSGIASVNKEAMVGLVQGHRAEVLAILRKGPSGNHAPLDPVHNGYFALVIHIDEHPRAFFLQPDR